MVTWLSEQEQVQWRAWLSAGTLLIDALSRDLQASHDMTMADYEILVRLSESPDHRMRMSELAEATLSSRSRLSHQIDRMEKQGLVARQACDDDRRGYFATLTKQGYATLVDAAPAHVSSVRARLVDVLTAEEFRALGAASQKLLDALEASDAQD